MKTKMFVLGLMLALSLVGLSGLRTYGQSNQNDTKQTKTSKRVYDIDGKRLRPDEKYIAERTLKDGRIIAYRKNKREIAALVKALKEEGFTDKKLLDPQTWLGIICWQSVSSGCQGGCDIGFTCKGTMDAVDRLSAQPHWQVRYCYCVQ